VPARKIMLGFSRLRLVPGAVGQRILVEYILFDRTVRGGCWVAQAAVLAV